MPYEILHKKIRIKPEELLPKAIPAQDIISLLGVIDDTHLPLTVLVDQFYSEVQAIGGSRWDSSSLLARLEKNWK